MGSKFVTVSIALLVSLAGAAHARDGRYHCKANGDIPLGVLSISGSEYDYVATRTSDFAPASDPANGGGRLDIQGASLIPRSGPLLTEFEVVGQVGDGIIWWNNRSGTLMACWPQ